MIRNLSRKKSADAQILMRNDMMERISLSAYRDKFILKGGMLVAAMVGLDACSTMDLDATVKGANVNVEDIENLISEIIAVPIDDGVTFQLKSISEIMDEAEYPGIRATMTTLFGGVRAPLKIDISTGDAITPREVRYSFKLMLEDRSIDIWAYNLEKETLVSIGGNLNTVIMTTVSLFAMCLLPFFFAFIFRDVGKTLAVPMVLFFLMIFLMNGDQAHFISQILPMGQLRLIALQQPDLSAIRFVFADFLWIFILYWGAYLGFRRSDLK